MNDELESIKYRGHEIVVFIDEDPENPRTAWDNLGKMICFNRRYNLGDKHDIDPSDYNDMLELSKAVLKEYDPCVMLPLFMYDHSVMHIKVGSYQGLLPQGHAEFDSYQIGWIIATKEQVRDEWKVKRISPKLRNKIEKVLRSEVETYDQYVSGRVYGFQIRDKDGNLEGGCWGFYGSDWKNNGLLEHAEPEIDCMVNDNIRTGVDECINTRLRTLQEYGQAIEETWGVELNF